MKIVVQRVSSASVTVDGSTVGAIGRGLLLLVGLGRDDSEAKFGPAIEKVLSLRIFPEEEKHFHLSTLDLKSDILLVSQFTLYGDCRKGRRPDFAGAMPPDGARVLWERFVAAFRAAYDGRVECGVFQAHMDVALVNDGPVTFELEF